MKNKQAMLTAENVRELAEEELAQVTGGSGIGGNPNTLDLQQLLQQLNQQQDIQHVEINIYNVP